MNRLARMTRDSQREAGAGIVAVMLVMAVVTALAITATSLTVSNLDNTRRDRQALTALATSEAGVSRAIGFLRNGSLGSLTCTEPAPGVLPGPSCQGAGPSWISATSPVNVKLDGTIGACTGTVDCYKVWIGTVKPYSPACPERFQSPARPCTGVYRIHATGVSGNGPGARQLAVDVEARPYPFPIGIFAESFSGNGNVGVHRQSLFTNGCIINRQRDDQSGSGFQFEYDSAAGRPKLDIVNDQPASAHSTNLISTSNNTCGTGSGGGPVHAVGAPCNANFKWDQSGWDATGTATDIVSGDACHGKYTRSAANGGGVYPTSSKFTAADLQSYGYRPRGLTLGQYEAMRAQADAEGTLNLAPAALSAKLSSLHAAGITSPVLYWDNGDVTLNAADFPSVFKRGLNTSTACGTASVTIVVEGPGHDLVYQGGNTSPYLVASIFVPDGVLNGAGGSNTIGTVFAKTLDLGGNQDFFMDECFAGNPPGGVIDVEVVSWREDDSRDIN